MATGLDLIYRTLRLLRVKQIGQTPASEETADALSVLNALLAELYGSDLQLPDYTVTLAGDLNMDAADTEAVAYLLALRLAPEYPACLPLSQEFISQAQQSESRLRLRYFQPGTVDLRELPGADCRDFDINNG
jgi:hypothetical protein